MVALKFLHSLQLFRNYTCIRTVSLDLLCEVHLGNLKPINILLYTDNLLPVNKTSENVLLQKNLLTLCIFQVYKRCLNQITHYAKGLHYKIISIGIALV